MSNDNGATITDAYKAASAARSEEIVKLRNAEHRLAQLLIGYRMLLHLGSPLSEALEGCNLDRDEYEKAISVLLETIESDVTLTEGKIAKLRPVVNRLLAAEKGLYEAHSQAG